MEVLQVATEIQKKISELQKALPEIKKRGEEKAETSAEYDKAVALVIIKIRNGAEMMFEDQKIVDPPATILEKIARGICYKEKLAMEKADAYYKSLITYISTVESQLNGWQSINRYLSEK